MSILRDLLGDEPEDDETAKARAEREAAEMQARDARSIAWLHRVGLTDVVDEPMLAPGEAMPLNPYTNKITYDEYLALRQVYVRAHQKDFTP
jgi:hypothetical protein